MSTEATPDPSPDPPHAREPAQGTDLIRAAGGILWRRSANGLEVALVHRIRHGDEWSLPKGKLDAGESWEQAALREVREETGCRARIIGFAGTIAYPVGDRPKIVAFWHMVPVGTCGNRLPDEVDEIAWLDPRGAAQKVTHKQVRDLLSTVEMPPEFTRQGWLSSLRQWYRRQFHNRRLAASLAAHIVELDKRIQDAKAQETSWALAVRSHLDRGYEVLDGSISTEEGWWSFLAAERAAIWGLDQSELDARAIALRREAGAKLGSWRKDLVEDLLPKDGFASGSLDNQQKRSLLEFTTLVRDEHLQNEYRKLAALQ